ncbi:hypothetical protein [Thermomonospora cellulosilytica]|uniref:Uncharacterized protein n=1 Tax=Thermomonospora cellulosilytica TaxID=1411118 RepID=A0A7W3MSW4_9ACTN|nr:hypothetical protein [Thermomonospora cellulosilytica]MBA9001269.1 hypothetical protein [Thermomonospora cellulosilytica]
MSGPEETSESVVDPASPASDGTPPTTAPPSFGQADSDDSGARPEPSSGPAAPSLTVPLFGPDKPWWAVDDEDEAPAEDEEPPAGENDAGEEPQDSPRPGTLVAGAGVPPVDTRGAVPAEPLQPETLPVCPDTDPDGIPLYPGPQEQPAEEAEERAEEQIPEVPEAQPVTPEPSEPSEPTQEAEEAPALDATRPDVTPSVRQALDETVPDVRSTLPVPIVGKSDDGERTRPLDEVGDDASDALTPDAVLPPGVVPPEYTGPKHEGLPHTAPAYAEQPGDGFVVVMSQETTHSFEQTGPQEAHQPPPPPARTAEETVVRRRNALLIGVVALVVAIPIIVLGAFGLASGSGGAASRADATPTGPGARKSTPPARPTQPPATPRTPVRPPVNIDDERFDTRPLALVEVFPEREVLIAQKFFVQDRTSVNHQCGLAARGVMVQALQRGKCRSVVRATFVNRIKTIAVTTGVAVMPNHRAAVAAHQAGDPAGYEWFSGMPGERSPDIDRAGGYAAGTVRGRYIVYAYATWADGTTPKPGDPVLKQVADAFIAYGLRPIERRANGT